MPLTIDAVYADGVLKPSEPLPLKEREKVRVTVESAEDLVRRSYGLLGWKGDHETLERVLAKLEESEDCL